MPTKLLQITFFSHYLTSPKTCIHRIPSKIKILIVFVYLLIVPYLSYQYIMILVIMSLSIILVLDIIIEYLLQLKYSMILTILHFSICCTNILHVYTSRYEQVFTLNHFIMSPHNIDRGDCSIDTLHICIIRSIIIYVIHSIIIRLLYLTTPYENIIVYTIPDNTMFCKKFIMNSIFIIAIGSQIIVLLTSKINILLRSLSLRNNHCKYSYIYILQHLCNILYYSISQLSSNLLYREICVDSCNFCDLNNTAY